MQKLRQVSLAELARDVLTRASQVDESKRFILGITGPPGAGKSTLACALRDTMNEFLLGETAEIAPMDGFHLYNEELYERGWFGQKGEPHTFDVKSFAAALEQARSRKLVSWPAYDRAKHDPTPDGIRLTDSVRIVITEGNYLLLEDGNGWSKVRHLLDETWYLDADVEVITRRLTERQIQGGRSEQAASQKVQTSDLPNAALVGRSIGLADVILRQDARSYYLVKPHRAAQ